MSDNSIHPSCFSTDILCKKCGHYDKGLFCSNCGFSFYKPRLSVFILIGRLTSELLDIERLYATTFKDLMMRPIDFINRYIQGDRENYYTPFKYLLINLSICFFITNFFDLQTSSDAVVSASEKKFDQIIYDYGKLYFLLIIPIFTICTKLFNRSTFYNAAEIATAITFLLGHMMGLEIILHLISSGFHKFYPIQKSIIFAAEAAIIFFLNYKFLQNTFFWSICKSLITLIAIYLGMKYALLMTHEIILIYYPA